MRESLARALAERPEGQDAFDALREFILSSEHEKTELDPPAHWEEYQVEADSHDRVLDVIQKVKWYHDESLALRRSCAHGVCGSPLLLGDWVIVCPTGAGGPSLAAYHRKTGKRVWQAGTGRLLHTLSTTA